MFPMDKVFHARIHFLMYLFLAVLVVGVCFSFLHRMGLCAALTLLLLVVAVERIIHTTYTVTADGRLVVSHGRFSRRLDIPLSGLRRVERIRRLRAGRHSLFSYLLVVYGDGKCVAVMPVQEEDFVAELKRRINKDIHSQAN